MTVARSGFVAVIAFGVIAVGCLADDPDPNVEVVNGNGTLVLTMNEYTYLPSSITVDAGATIDLVVVNDGRIEHEIMIGSSALDDGGFANDLLARLLSVQPDAVVETAFTQSDGDPPDDEGSDCAEPVPDHDDGRDADHTHDPPDLPADCEVGDPDMGHDEDRGSTNQQQSDDHDGSDGHHDDEPDGTDSDETDETGDMAHDGSDGHHDGTSEMGHDGAHITVPAGQTQRVELKIPHDADGHWEIGCFIPGHYEAGMAGVFIVRSADAGA